MNKETLETNRAALELLLNENTDKRTDYEAQIAKIDQQLKDLGKIALPPIVFDDIYEAVEEACGNFDFSDTDNFDIEYGIEYDGKVYCESHEMNDTSKLVELVVEEISKIFTEAECPEDDNHPEEKLQN